MRSDVLRIGAIKRWPAVMLFFSVAFFAVGCPEKSDQTQRKAEAPSPKEPAYRVLDNFQVGKNVYVRALTVEQERRGLWVGTSVGVLEIDLSNHSMRNTFTREQGLANEYVFAIGIDAKGQKWFGTNAGGMSRYKAGQWKTYFPMHGLADYWVYSFANQGPHYLWIGTWAGVNRLDLRTGKMDTFVKELVNVWVYAIAVDSKQRVWFGTEGGVSMFDGKQWKSWTHEQGIGAPNSENLSASKNTGLGTRSRHDLGVLRGGRATYNPSYVFSIFVAPDDTIWVGTWGGGVSHFNGKEWRSLTRADGLAGNIVYSVAQGRNGAMWFGTDGGVSRYVNGVWQTFNRRNGLPNIHVYAIAIDARNNEVWAGTRGSVVRIGRAPSTISGGK